MNKNYEDWELNTNLAATDRQTVISILWAPDGAKKGHKQVPSVIIMVTRAQSMCESGHDPINCKSSLSLPSPTRFLALLLGVKPVARPSATPICKFYTGSSLMKICDLKLVGLHLIYTWNVQCLKNPLHGPITPGISLQFCDIHFLPRRRKIVSFSKFSILVFKNKLK